MSSSICMINKSNNEEKKMKKKNLLRKLKDRDFLRDKWTDLQYDLIDLKDRAIDNIPNICIASIVAGFLVYSAATVINGIDAKKYKEKGVVYEDVNKDGLKDKIVHDVKRKGVFPFSCFVPENDTLYGIKLNGKTIYLSSNQLDETK